MSNSDVTWQGMPLARHTRSQVVIRNSKRHALKKKIDVDEPFLVSGKVGSKYCLPSLDQTSERKNDLVYARTTVEEVLLRPDQTMAMAEGQFQQKIERVLKSEDV